MPFAATWVDLEIIKSDRNIYHLYMESKIWYKETEIGTSLMVQGFRLHAPKAGGPGFDPWSRN